MTSADAFSIVAQVAARYALLASARLHVGLFYDAGGEPFAKVRWSDMPTSLDIDLECGGDLGAYRQLVEVEMLAFRNPGAAGAWVPAVGDVVEAATVARRGQRGAVVSNQGGRLPWIVRWPDGCETGYAAHEIRPPMSPPPDPVTPAGRLQVVADLAREGKITAEQARLLIEMPALEPEQLQRAVHLLLNPAVIVCGDATAPEQPSPCRKEPTTP